jgi:AraC-like DNA-binding protein
MLLLRARAALAPFVECLWYSDDTDAPRAARERALPTGCTNLVFRLGDQAIRVFAGPDDARGSTFGLAAVSGVRSTFYLRDTTRPARTVGVQFRPAGAAALLGVPAIEFAERHTPLQDLWGREADRARERLLAAGSPARQLALLERLLLARLPDRAGPHPAVAHAVARLDAAATRPCSVQQIARETGWSERHLLGLFRLCVGIGPKAYARIRRFDGLLRRAARGKAHWAGLAAACGYSDQSHLVREFHALAGSAPGAYAPLSPERPHHVPVPAAPGGLPIRPSV